MIAGVNHSDSYSGPWNDRAGEHLLPAADQEMPSSDGRSASSSRPVTDVVHAVRLPAIDYRPHPVLRTACQNCCLLGRAITVYESRCTIATTSRTPPGRSRSYAT
jgi:hypothetical protein